MRRTLILLSASLLGALALAACGGTTPRGGGGGGPMPYCAADELQIPVLVSPADGSNVEMAGLTFHWIYNPAGCLPEEFEVQVSQTVTFDNFSGATLDYGEDHWSPQVGMLPATVYYWRMRGTVSGGPGPWSPVWSFYTGPVCSADSLVAPEIIFPNGKMFANSPYFQWSYPGGDCVAEGYHLQVSSDPAFSALTLDLHQAGPLTQAQPSVDYENCTLYYWRVAATQGDSDGPFSPTANFSTNLGASCTQQCTTDQLVAPMLYVPGNYEVVSADPDGWMEGSLLWWHWPMPCLPGGFGIHLSTSPDFSGPSLGGGASPVTSWLINWSPAQPLEPATQYWWEVFAGVDTTFGPASQRRAFFTGPECESGADAIPPTLLSPEDGAVVDTLTPWLHYTPGSGGCIPDGYAIYLDTDPDFAGEDPYASHYFPGTNFIPDPLQDCTTYFWRVSPIQDDFVLPWSEVWSFRTQAGAACLSADQFQGIALQEAACLHGPGPGWPTLGYLVAGDRVPIFGTDMARRWLAIDNPDNPGQRCWVPEEAIEPEGDTGRLRILNPPLACTNQLSQTECVSAGGTWIPRPATGGPGGNYCQCP